MACLTRYPIVLDELLRAVAADDRGGVASFLGVVRNHHAGELVLQIEYSAHEPLAEAECCRIVGEAESRWSCRAVVSHRLGVLGVGETAVAIVAGAAHRAEAFDACRYIIEEVKRRVPIWKRERYVDGREVWVDPTAPGGAVAARVRDSAEAE